LKAMENEIYGVGTKKRFTFVKKRRRKTVMAAEVIPFGEGMRRRHTEGQKNRSGCRNFPYTREGKRKRGVSEGEISISM